MATNSAGWRALLSKRMLICVFTGFSSGLPLWLALNLVPAWLKTTDVSLTNIGLLSLVQFPYTWKFLWAPLLDRYTPPVLGRRRGWLAATQVLLVLSIGSLGFVSPVQNLELVALWSVLIALFSATQDIALDAYRRELLPETELGLGNSVFVTAYKVAGLVPGSLSLILADHLPWSQVFVVTALFMLPGLATTLLVNEPQAMVKPRTLRDAVVEPFREFITRKGWQTAAVMLAFMFLYKLGDSLCTAIATPFYLDLGYSKSQVGLVAKQAMLWPSVFGGIAGGLWMVKLGINRALWLFGLVQVGSVLGFAWLASHGHQSTVAMPELLRLGVVIGLEALGVGLGTAAFVAFIARATHPAYTATQFALFSSLVAVPRTFVNASAGWLVSQMGWFWFFVLCSALTLPGLALLLKVAPWKSPEPA